MTTEMRAVVGDVIQLTRERIVYDRTWPIGAIGIVIAADTGGAAVEMLGYVRDGAPKVHSYPHHNAYQIVWTDR